MKKIKLKNNAFLSILLTFPLTFFISTTTAQINTTDLPITIDAESTDYEGNPSILKFKKLNLSQGNIKISSDTGQASKLDFENSTWQFLGNVKITLENGVILANKTYLEFQGHQIKIANITGSKENQVILEFQRQEKDHITTAMADRIDYDFEAAMIDFSGNVTIVEDGNQISSNYLVYNIEQQSIQAQSNIADNPKVRITYTPRKIDDSNLNKEK